MNYQYHSSVTFDSKKIHFVRVEPLIFHWLSVPFRVSGRRNKNVAGNEPKAKFKKWQAYWMFLLLYILQDLGFKITTRLFIFIKTKWKLDHVLILFIMIEHLDGIFSYRCHNFSQYHAWAEFASNISYWNYLFFHFMCFLAWIPLQLHLLH